jgi:hypothetical protein
MGERQMLPVHTKQIRKSAVSSKMRAKFIVHSPADSAPPQAVRRDQFPRAGPRGDAAVGSHAILSLTKGDAVFLTPAGAGDAALRQALEIQEQQLGIILARLEAARRDLIPPPAQFWRGSARHAYDAGIDAMRGTVDAAVAAVSSAHYRTIIAVSEMTDRETISAEGGVPSGV